MSASVPTVLSVEVVPPPAPAKAAPQGLSQNLHGELRGDEITGDLFVLPFFVPAVIAENTTLCLFAAINAGTKKRYNEVISILITSSYRFSFLPLSMLKALFERGKVALDIVR